MAIGQNPFGYWDCGPLSEAKLGQTRPNSAKLGQRLTVAKTVAEKI